MSATIADVLAGRATWAAGCCDGFALARWLGAGAVDHVIGDPPYDEKTHAGARTMTDKGENAFIDFPALPSVESFLPMLVSCARRWTVLFCSLSQLGEYERAAGGTRDDGGTFIRTGFWHRTNPAPQIIGDRPGQPGEGIAILHAKGGKMRWNRGGHQAFWEGVTAKGEPRRIHKTKKPLWLMEALIRDFTDPGDLIFDPTMGEGTTGEAAINLGRRFIGCEIANGIDASGKYDAKRDYFGAAVNRLTRAAARPRQAMLLGTDAAPRQPRAKTIEMFASKP